MKPERAGRISGRRECLERLQLAVLARERLLAEWRDFLPTLRFPELTLSLDLAESDARRANSE